MKKKSHLSLARYLIDNMHNEDLEKHRRTFLIGNIWPDCIPSFITKRHTIDETFDLLKKEIIEITENHDWSKGITRSFCRHLGIITHYVADYFTLPHNTIFTGTMKEHIKYEFKLMDKLEAYLNSGEADHFLEHTNNFYSVEHICEFIKEMHSKYINAIKKISIDCQYIVELCVHVVKAILQIFEFNFISSANRQIKMA